MVTIAVDMMGSDSGVSVLAQSVKHYLNEHSDVKFYLFGDEREITDAIKDSKHLDRIEIFNALKTIPMEIKPLDFLRSKDSSMYQAIDSVRTGLTSGVLSAGSTGGFLTGATIILRNIKGVSRAGLCTPFPTAIKDKGTVILDVGANNYNTAEDVAQFAKMGALYSKEILGVKEPGVWILSNGQEEGKGTDEVVGAYRMLKEQNFPNFKGNVEAREVLDGTHDVVVTPGYAGNIFLKATEGMASIMNDSIKKSFKRNLMSKIGYLLAKKGFDEMKETMNYRKYGGAILLGIDGVVVKAHGNSNEYAFYQAIDLTKRMIETDIISKMKKEFSGQ